MDAYFTDIDHVTLHDRDILEIYKEAKELYYDVPIAALMKIRKINSMLVDSAIIKIDASKKNKSKKGIFNKIRDLENSDGYSPAITKLFHSIRDKCNIAAHMENHEIQHDDLVVLAKEALIEICEVISLMDPFACEKDTSRYKFVEHELPLLKDLLYSAVVKQDTQAKVKAGNILAESWIIDEENETDIKQGLENKVTFNSYHYELASQMLYSAAVDDHDPDGLYSLGKLLCYRMLPERKDTPSWEELLLESANMGHIEARKFWGVRKLIDRTGSLNCDNPLEEALLALSFVQEYSTSEICQYVLSLLYGQGYLVDRCLKTSLYHLKKAAEIGHRVAQHKYAQICSDNGDIETSEEMIILSALNGYKPALLIILNNSSISYEDRVAAFDSYQMIDRTYGETDFMSLNSDIEIKYAELICTDSRDPVRLGSVAVLVNNYLTMNHSFLPDEQFRKYIFMAAKALNEGKDKRGLDCLGNSVMNLLVFRQHAEVLKKRQEEKVIRQQEQMEKQQIAIRSFRNKVNGMKIGRNEPCSCNSGKKYKNCCLG